LSTNGGAAYAKIFDNDSQELFPVFSFFLEKYLDRTTREFDIINSTEDFKHAMMETIHNTEKQTRDARLYDGKSLEDVICHKVYAVVYYGANGDQSLHIDIFLMQYQAVCSCQSNTKLTTVVQVRDIFTARNFEELKKVVETQRGHMINTNETFPSLEVSLNSLRNEFRKKRSTS
jgi:hypothetical protein